MPAEFAPIAVVDLELSAPLVAISAIGEDGSRYGAARILVRLHTRPLGVIDLALGNRGISGAECADAVWSVLGSRINEHLRGDSIPEVEGLDAGGLPAPDAPPCTEHRRSLLRDPPLASVVICTRNRAELLGRCLHSLRELDYPDVELTVVDSSAGAESADLVRREFPNASYVHVGSNGLSVARNRGVAAASGRFVAFTDDDVRVDSHWLTELIAPFASDERVACTTGVVLPLELETPAQLWFEESGAFTEGFDRRVLDIAMAAEPGSLLPYATGRIGAGVSMAWRRSVLSELGGFDVALDTLTPPWPPRAPHGTAGEDLAAFFDALVNGYRIVFEPGAIVLHEHRRTYDELAGQLYWHGMGLSAYLTRCLVKRPGAIPGFLRRVPRGLSYGFAADSPRNRKKSVDFPPGLTRAERRGVIHGPFAYFRGIPRARRIRALEEARAAS